MTPHAMVELVGGPMCGMRVPLMTIDARELARRIGEELATDPLAGTRFECPPPVLEDVCFMLQHAVTGVQAIYAFGIPWTTEDKMFLRAEHVPWFSEGREDDGELAFT